MKTHLLAVGVTLIVGASVACYAADAETPKAVIAEVRWPRARRRPTAALRICRRRARRRFACPRAVCPREDSRKASALAGPEAPPRGVSAGSAVPCPGRNRARPPSVLSLSRRSRRRLPRGPLAAARCRARRRRAGRSPPEGRKSGVAWDDSIRGPRALQWRVSSPPRRVKCRVDSRPLESTTVSVCSPGPERSSIR